MVGHVAAATHKVAPMLAKTRCCTDARLSSGSLEPRMHGRHQGLGHFLNHNAKHGQSGRLAGVLPASVTGVFQKHQDFRIQATNWFLSLRSPSTVHRLCAKSLRRKKKSSQVGMPVSEGMSLGTPELCSSSKIPGHSQPLVERWHSRMQRQKSRVLAAGEDPGGSSSESEIPATSDEFLRKVSSESYTSLSKQMQEKEEASFEVLERDPWGEDDKMVYVLAQKEESLFTMKVRKDRSDVEREFTTLFPSIGSRQRWKRPEPAKPPAGDEQEPTRRFSMHVDTVSEGILVFEDEDEATRFCGLLETDGHQDLSVVETDAPGLFALCQRSKAVAILFRHGVMPPLPDRLQRALRARKFSLDD